MEDSTSQELEVDDVDGEVDRLMRGCEFGDGGLEAAMRHRLEARVAEARREGRPLRVYAGYDATAPRLHLGHAITLRKLRQFQDLGHDVTVVVGTVTARIGDASDRASARAAVAAAEVAVAAAALPEQVAAVLDPDRTRVVQNGDWLSDLALPEIIGLAANFTVQQFLARDSFRRRLDAGEALGLHELLYALLQAYDAVHLRADVQLGATEQLFNILAGAKLQEALGQPPLVALTFPILVGTDGERMSKSRGNTVDLTAPADEQFGRTMSVSDPTMLQWARLATTWEEAELTTFEQAVASGDLHPMEAKKRLAHHVVCLYHGTAEADAARDRFERVTQRNQLPHDLEPIAVDMPVPLVELLVQLDGTMSRSAARRLITGGGVRIDGVRVLSPDETIDRPMTIRLGRRRFYRVDDRR